MNYRLLSGLIMAFSYQTITFAMHNPMGPWINPPAMQGQPAQWPIPAATPTQASPTNLHPLVPRPFLPPTTFERFKNHVSRNAALYIMGGAIAAGMGLFLYMDHRSKVRIKKMFEKDEKKRLKQTMDLVTFNDEKFLKTVTGFVNEKERSFQQEKALLIDKIDFMNLSKEEKNALKTAIESASLAETDSPLYEESSKALYQVMKSTAPLMNQSPSGEIVITSDTESLLRKAKEQLVQRMTFWSKDAEEHGMDVHKKAAAHQLHLKGTELSQRMTSLALQLAAAHSLMSFIVMEQRFELHRNEQIIAEKMRAHEPFEEELQATIHAYNLTEAAMSIFPNVSYVAMLEKANGTFDSLLDTLNSSVKLSFQQESIEKCKALSEALRQVAAHVKNQPGYAQEHREYQQKREAERKEAEHKREQAALRQELSSLKSEIASLQSSVRSLRNLTTTPIWVRY